MVNKEIFHFRNNQNYSYYNTYELTTFIPKRLTPIKSMIINGNINKDV